MKTPNQILKTYLRLGKTKVSSDSLKCRMCLSRFTDMIDIFLVESEPLSNISIIHFCTGLEISENDGLPTRMCTKCYRNMVDFFAFKRMCLASDTRLKSSRDAAIKLAEIPNTPLLGPDPEVKVEPQDELSLAENSDMVLLETDGFHPDAPDEVFSQIAKFEPEEECNARNWDFPNTPAVFGDKEEGEAINMNDEGTEEDNREDPLLQDSQCQLQGNQHQFEDNLCQLLDSHADMSVESAVFLGHSQPRKPAIENNSPSPAPQRLYSCPICFKQFRHSCTMKRHTMIHVGPQYQCPHCEKAFNQKDSLKRHLLTHMDRRFVCAECSKVLVSRAGLKCHIRTHHTDRSETNNYFKYKCLVCTKSFAHASGLSRHTAIHRGVKHECNLCQKKFNDTTQLKRHKRIHLRESDGSNREVMSNKVTDANNRNGKDESAIIARLPVSPQPLDCRVNRRETGETDVTCDVQEKKTKSDTTKEYENKINMKNVTVTPIRPECQSGGDFMESKLMKIPCNRKFYGEERPKYVVLQAL